MAEEHPPSHKCKDNTFSLGRLRVKPAMRGYSVVLVSSGFPFVL